MIDKDTVCTIESLCDVELGYKLPSGVQRTLVPRVKMEVTAGELRELFYAPGGQYMLQQLIRVNNKELAAEFGRNDDDKEYWWTLEDMKKCLLEDKVEVLLDALDFAPDGVCDTLRDMAIEYEIKDGNKIDAINKKFNIDINQMIANKHAYDEFTAQEEKPRQRRVNDESVKRTRRVQ